MGGMKDSGLSRRHGERGDHEVHRRRRTSRSQYRLGLGAPLGLSAQAWATALTAVAEGDEARRSPVTAADRHATYDVDVVVVGSGFGGSVAALRLSEKGYGVTVLESGRRFDDDELARTSWDVRRYFWAPRLGCYGVQRIHQLPDVVLLAGAGVGGGSLNYANTLYVPPKAFFDDPQWSRITDWADELAPHYDQAARMLGVVREPVCAGPVEEIMRAVADDMGVGHTFRQTPVGVFFGRPDPATGESAPRARGHRARPVLRWRRTRPAPAARSAATAWSAAGSGPRTRWSRTTWRSPSRLGARVEPMRTVVDVRPLDPARPEAGFAVTSERTGAWLRRDRRTVTAGQVVLRRGDLGHPEAAARRCGRPARCRTCRRGWAS